MSHTSNNPPVKYAAADLPTDLPEGTVAYDTTNQKMVAFKQGAWGDLGGAGGIGSTTYVRDNVAGVIDQVQGDIPAFWKNLDTSLKGVVIGTSCEIISVNAFKGCTGLTGSLSIPKNVKKLKAAAFRDCTGITGHLDLTELIEIDIAALQGLSGITSFSFPVALKDNTIGLSFLSGASSLTGHVIIPDYITEIRETAFSLCGFDEVTIPDSVTIIRTSAFAQNPNLTNANCYVTLSNINFPQCFNGCSNLTTVHARASDDTWTAGAGQTIGGQTNVTVIKDL